MSRIGNLVINIPSSVTVLHSGTELKVSGPLGELELNLAPEITIEIKEDKLQVLRKAEDSRSKAMHGLFRSLIANMVLGVSQGFEKKLELIGVGFRAQVLGELLILNVGFSHPVEVTAPAGIKFSVLDNTKITVSGAEKSVVGETAAKIRSIKPPEPYQGKGIRYVGEYVRRKAGKAGKVGAGAAK